MVRRYSFGLNLDFILLFSVFILTLIGLMMMFSTTAVVGLTQFQDPYYYVKRQGLFMMIGFVALLVGYKIPHLWYRKFALHGFFMALFILILTLIPGLSVTAGGASRWLDLGVILFQPVELAKFFIVVFLATALCNKKDMIHTFWKGFIPVLLLSIVPICILMAQPDLGNSVLIFLVLIIMLFVAGVRLLHLMILGGGALLSIVISILMHPYQFDRIKGFLNPWADPLGKSYHIIQSYTAIGSGGILGHGFGQSKLKFFYLPLHYSDFIFSIICEEGGFIFALVVLALFAVILYRSVHIALLSQHRFSCFLVLGLILFLVLQALINIGVAVGVFPITGIPLTFISYGGTSFVMSLFFIGVILNVSRE
tara:strand:+ start:124 stop:1224 length:1101 start_codon:yes stop_codon:yes gene_type:complete